MLNAEKNRAESYILCRKGDMFTFRHNLFVYSVSSYELEEIGEKFCLQFQILLSIIWTEWCEVGKSVSFSHIF